MMAWPVCPTSNINGSQVAVGSTWTVNSVDASVGDSLTCTAIAVDFEGNSTTSTSVGFYDNEYSAGCEWCCVEQL